MSLLPDDCRYCHPYSGRHRWGSRNSPYNPFARLEDVMVDMDRQFSWLERDVNTWMQNLGFRRPAPPGQLGHYGPTTESESGEDAIAKEPPMYTMNIHLGGQLGPEDVKVTAKDHVLKVEVKKEFESEDGKVRTYQEFLKRFKIPDSVDMNEVRSVLTPEGDLKIEAPLPLEALPEPKKDQPILITV